MDYVGMVREFHLKMNLVVAGKELNQLEPDVQVKRARLMTEEVGELVCAMDQEDIGEVADAACDLIYVIGGTAVAYGFKNITNRTYEEFVGGRILNPTPILKPSVVMDLIEMLTVKLGKVNETLTRPWPSYRMRDELSGFVQVVFEVSQWYGLPLDECFAEVHRSNMTKTPLDKFSKGGKGEGYTPPRLSEIIYPFGSSGRVERNYVE
jgi:hypothetical protein